ncbi:MAG: hypothetical protein Q9169_005743 [Polycauliona sp. 2 TL-2023]
MPDSTKWQLTNKISEKAWEGSDDNVDRKQQMTNWQPDEAHAVYECTQIHGPCIGTIAIMKIRIEVPHHLPRSRDPLKRANDASGMRLNRATTNEIETLMRLTAAGCSATPRFLDLKIEKQDGSVLSSHHGKTTDSKPNGGEEGVQWWMPGGYIVYILMEKLLQARRLDIGTYWNEDLITAEEREEVRAAFKKSCMELRRLGVAHGDPRLENLMWDRTRQKW